MEQEIKNSIEQAKLGLIDKKSLKKEIEQFEHDIAKHVAHLVAGGQTNLRDILVAKLNDLKNIYNLAQDPQEPLK